MLRIALALWARAAVSPPVKTRPGGTGEPGIIDRMSRRFALTRRPFLPLCPSNLRCGHGDLVVRKKHRKKIGRGEAGHSVNSRLGQGGNPHPSSWDGGKVPLYRRFPKWPMVRMHSKRNSLEQLNLSKLRYFIEKGRLDARFPITLRHFRDCGCVSGIKHGVKIFNVNDYPFPYKIDVEVSSADQSTFDAIKRVGGSVTIVHFDCVGLRAHLRPWRFAVLPKTARPSVAMVGYLEKMRLRGCRVRPSLASFTTQPSLCVCGTEISRTAASPGLRNKLRTTNDRRVSSHNLLRPLLR
jgi:large subunit ribosomal protein L15